MVMYLGYPYLVIVLPLNSIIQHPKKPLSFYTQRSICLENYGSIINLIKVRSIGGEAYFIRQMLRRVIKRVTILRSPIFWH